MKRIAILLLEDLQSNHGQNHEHLNNSNFCKNVHSAESLPEVEIRMYQLHTPYFLTHGLSYLLVTVRRQSVNLPLPWESMLRIIWQNFKADLIVYHT